MLLQCKSSKRTHISTVTISVGQIDITTLNLWRGPHSIKSLSQANNRPMQLKKVWSAILGNKDFCHKSLINPIILIIKNSVASQDKDMLPKQCCIVFANLQVVGILCLFILHHYNISQGSHPWKCLSIKQCWSQLTSIYCRVRPINYHWRPWLYETWLVEPNLLRDVSLFVFLMLRMGQSASFKTHFDYVTFVNPVFSFSEWKKFKEHQALGKAFVWRAAYIFTPIPNS